MKFSIERDTLFRALDQMQSVVEKRNSVEILGNLLCVAQKDKLSVYATDLEVGLQIDLPAQVEEAGKLTIPSKQFFEIVRELPSKNIRISKKANHWVEILSQKSKFNVMGLAAEEYPPQPDFNQGVYVETKMSALQNMIEKTSFAVSNDSSRYNLNGIYLEHLGKGLLRMAATDGHRLSFIDQELFLGAPDLPKGVIVPKKGAMELRKVLSAQPESMSLSIQKGFLFLRMKKEEQHWSLFIRLIDGEYPDYRQVIPSGIQHKAKINIQEFSGALRRVSLLAHEKSKGVKLSFQKDQLTLTTSNPEMGEAREELDCVYEGAGFETGFNAKYLLDCLSVMDAQDIEMQFKDRLSSGLIQAHRSNAVNPTYVVMPMRI